MRRSFRILALAGTWAAALLAAALILAPDGDAQPHDGGRMEPRGGFERRDDFARRDDHTLHRRFDGRFHHDRFYPELGFAVGALPLGYLAIRGRDSNYFFAG